MKPSSQAACIFIFYTKKALFTINVSLSHFIKRGSKKKLKSLGHSIMVTGISLA
jgi:hypothetical protein